MTFLQLEEVHYGYPHQPVWIRVDTITAIAPPDPRLGYSPEVRAVVQHVNGYANVTATPEEILELLVAAVER